ncbi:MAG: malonyl-ACP O-methyltransferase BioC [Alistipes senegalensis]|nr:malonyl-ACP O-methyltransferase BioC [Oxalobacter formigenes]MCM1281146.1 malonyl-ACP O-methyltransferase BioC [Alistipes senegalensis]
MLPAVDKIRVGAAFNRAAREYDNLARFQQTVCHDLINHLPAFFPDMPPPRTVLDGGCGTGYGAGLLKCCWPDCRITGCDLSMEMLQLAGKKGINTVCADLEHLPFADKQFELVWSSLALQWCRPDQVYAELYRILAVNGILLFSTLGPGTLSELDYAFSGIDNHRHIRTFIPPQQTKSALHQAGFRHISITCETRTVGFPDFHSFLLSVRGIGANQIGKGQRRALMGKNTWKKAQERYESLRREDGMLPATYKLVFGFALR